MADFGNFFDLEDGDFNFPGLEYGDLNNNDIIADFLTEPNQPSPHQNSQYQSNNPNNPNNPNIRTSLYKIQQSTTPYFVEVPFLQDEPVYTFEYPSPPQSALGYENFDIVAPTSQPGHKLESPSPPKPPFGYKYPSIVAPAFQSVQSPVTEAEAQNVIDHFENQTAFTTHTKKMESNKKRKSPTSATHSPRHAYTDLALVPESWHCFSYNRFGELEPGRLYSVLQIAQLLCRNPRSVTLRIQRTPPEHASRHGDARAGQCRFENCDKHNLISPGELRVAFDEITESNATHDPQHCAGFVHLSCLEKCLNFPKIVLGCTVKAEDRVLPLERTQKNWMILTNIGELDQAENFLKFCKDTGRPPLSYHTEGGKLYEQLERHANTKANGPSQDDWMREGRVATKKLKESKERQKAEARHRREKARNATEQQKTKSKKRTYEPQDGEDDRPTKKRARLVKARCSTKRKARKPEPESESDLSETEEERPRRRRRKADPDEEYCARPSIRARSEEERPRRGRRKADPDEEYCARPSKRARREERQHLRPLNIENRAGN